MNKLATGRKQSPFIAENCFFALLIVRTNPFYNNRLCILLTYWYLRSNLIDLTYSVTLIRYGNVIFFTQQID